MPETKAGKAKAVKRSSTKARLMELRKDRAKLTAAWSAAQDGPVREKLAAQINEIEREIRRLERRAKWHPGLPPPPPQRRTP